MLKITDKSFQYTPSFNTDLKKKFAKMIRDQKQAEREKQRAEEARRKQVVVPMGEKKR